MVICWALTFYHESEETVWLMVQFPIQTINIFLMKNTLLNPRPYWVYDTITSYDCKDGFGNPSGHATCASFFTTYIYFGYIWPKLYKPYTAEMSTFDKLALLVSGLFFLTAHALMDYSRVVLGAHGIN